MESNEAFEKVLHAFEQYYNVKTQDVTPPFCAEAEFRSHNEQYFLVKSAKVADIDSNEFVFIAKEQTLTVEQLSHLDQVAWQTGLSRVTPYYGHRNSDVTLVIIADTIEADAFKQVKKLKHYKSYKFSLYGWSAFRAVAYETSTGKVACNRRGSDLKKLVS